MASEALSVERNCRSTREPQIPLQLFWSFRNVYSNVDVLGSMKKMDCISCFFNSMFAHTIHARILAAASRRERGPLSSTVDILVRSYIMTSKSQHDTTGHRFKYKKLALTPFQVLLGPYPAPSSFIKDSWFGWFRRFSITSFAYKNIPNGPQLKQCTTTCRTWQWNPNHIPLAVFVTLETIWVLSSCCIQIRLVICEPRQ